MPKFKCTYEGCGTAFDTAQKRGLHEFSAHERETLKPINHGTIGGYSAHKRRNENPCSKCRSAWREYYSKKRSSS